MKNIATTLFFILTFCFAVLAQTSFAFRLGISGVFFYLILFFLLFLLAIEDSNSKNGVITAFLVGFFWDLFSLKPFGFYMIILGISSLAVKYLIKSYVKWK